LMMMTVVTMAMMMVMTWWVRVGLWRDDIHIGQDVDSGATLTDDDNTQRHELDQPAW
jgi:hypothetical protein